MKTTTKKTRGIRQPRGYEAGHFGKNLYVAGVAHISGSEIVSPEASAFFDGCKSLAELFCLKSTKTGNVLNFKSHGLNKAAMRYYKLTKSNLEKAAMDNGLEISAMILGAIENKDGYFFKDLARLCEAPEAKLDLRGWLVLVHWDLWKGTRAGREQDHIYTAKEICEMAFKRGFKHGQSEMIPERRMHEFCGELGIKLKKNQGKRR